MAYVISKNNIVMKVAANEAAKNEMNFAFPPYVATEVNDADFAKYIKHRADFTIAGDGTVTAVDLEQPSFADQETLELYIGSVKETMNQFLKAPNSSKTIYSTINTYKSTLDSFDFSTITYPLNKSWEEYCEENSITYVHPLQIP